MEPRSVGDTELFPGGHKKKSAIFAISAILASWMSTFLEAAHQGLDGVKLLQKVKKVDEGS